MAFSYTQNNLFRQYKYCNYITKVQSATKQIPEPSRIITAYLEYTFTVLNAVFQLANSKKFFMLLVLLKTHTQVTIVFAIKAIRRH